MKEVSSERDEREAGLSKRVIAEIKEVSKKVWKTESNVKGLYPQPKEEIVKNLEAIANSKCVKQPDHIEASLWNAIEILEDLIAKEDGE